jgi:hypothetical protein
MSGLGAIVLLFITASVCSGLRKETVSLLDYVKNVLFLAHAPQLKEDR